MEWLVVVSHHLGRYDDLRKARRRGLRREKLRWHLQTELVFREGGKGSITETGAKHPKTDANKPLTDEITG